MRSDKKSVAGRMRFVLPSRLGAVELVGDVPEREVVAIIAGFGRSVARVSQDSSPFDRVFSGGSTINGNWNKPKLEESDQNLAPQRYGQLV